MDGVRQDDWISTGKAAKKLGYDPDWFRTKFLGVIPSRRLPGGHHRWLASAVEELAAQPDRMPEAG